MNFRLEFDPPLIFPQLEHHLPVFLIGSCFTENIGEKLAAAKFETFQNPHGILFNPVSVCNSLQACVHNEAINSAGLFELNEAWHSWDFHSRFSAPGKPDALEKMQAQVSAAHAFLKTAGLLIITLGSAWVYRLTEEAPARRFAGQVAANNHKAPAQWFNRQLLPLQELQQMLQQTIAMLQAFNPALHIIFTISPVRHIREGFVENNRSKAVLMQAVHAACGPQVSYFPAYELVIDDLRDYRFFAEDMVHPNYAATQYVWEKFVACAMPVHTQALIRDLNQITRAYRHKPFNAESAAHKKFLKTYLDKTLAISKQYPALPLQEELLYFSKNSL